MCLIELKEEGNKIIEAWAFSARETLAKRAPGTEGGWPATTAGGQANTVSLGHTRPLSFIYCLYELGQMINLLGACFLYM